MMLCARSTLRSSEQSTKYRSRSEKVWLFHCQNNKIVWLPKWKTYFGEIHKVCKGLWVFFLIVLFGCWLAEQANSDHMVWCLKNLRVGGGGWAMGSFMPQTLPAKKYYVRQHSSLRLLENPTAPIRPKALLHRAIWPATYLTVASPKHWRGTWYSVSDKIVSRQVVATVA